MPSETTDNEEEPSEKDNQPALSLNQIKDVISNHTVQRAIGIYIVILVASAIFGGPNQIVGIVSITAAGIILYATQHPSGSYTYETRRQQLVGILVGLSFLVMGMIYLLTGFVWNTFPLY